MQEWLEQNKEWLLSGIGVTIILSSVTVVSSVIAYWINSRKSKKLEKKLNIEINLKQYQIQSKGKTVDLTVDYEGNTYRNLCEYSVTAYNNGLVAIEKQQILFVFPFDCSMIKRFEEKSSESIRMDCGVFNKTEVIEHLYEFDRLEPADQVTFIYLIDTDKADDFSCKGRGVDGVNYSYSQSEATSRSDFLDLWVYFSFFVFSGSIPLVGGFFQSAVVLIAGPTVLRLIKSLNTVGPAVKSSPITLQEVSVKEGGNLDIRIKH